MKEKNYQLNANRMQLGDLVRNYWVVDVEEGVTRKDLLKHDFWAHVAQNLAPYDRIEARADDESFFAEYLVLRCDRTFAQIKELSFVSLDEAVAEMKNQEMSEFDIKWKGPKHKWCVIRKSDEAMIKNEMSKEEAYKFLSGYIKTIAA